MQPTKSKDSKVLGYCSVDRRVATVISTDIANIVASVLLLGTATISVLALLAISEKAPVITITYSHPTIMNTIALSKQYIINDIYPRKTESNSYRYLEFCTTVDIHNAVVSNTLVTKTGILTLPSTSLTIDKGCYTANLPVLMPSDLPRGNYVLESRIHGRLNILNSFDTPFYSLPIEIK